MEMNLRRGDMTVTRPIGESRADKDSQLDAAVSELLKQIDAAKPNLCSAKFQSN